MVQSREASTVFQMGSALGDHWAILTVENLEYLTEQPPFAWVLKGDYLASRKANHFLK